MSELALSSALFKSVYIGEEGITPEPVVIQIIPPFSKRFRNKLNIMKFSFLAPFSSDTLLYLCYVWCSLLFQPPPPSHYVGFWADPKLGSLQLLLD